jgi:hypothetical protein
MNDFGQTPGEAKVCSDEDQLVKRTTLRAATCTGSKGYWMKAGTS